MLLLIAATQLEMAPFLDGFENRKGVECLVTGVGLLETSVILAKRLSVKESVVQRVIQFGVCGAYPGTGASLLDICVAENEILGDLGICSGDRIQGFDGAHFSTSGAISLRSPFQDRCLEVLGRNQVSFYQGNFVTVNCVSGTEKRGILLRDEHNALCENMEGAAAARVSMAYDVPFFEIRCVSNMVEDRDLSRWKLAEAARKSAGVAAVLAQELI